MDSLKKFTQILKINKGFPNGSGAEMLFCESLLPYWIQRRSIAREKEGVAPRDIHNHATLNGRVTERWRVYAWFMLPFFIIWIWVYLWLYESWFLLWFRLFEWGLVSFGWTDTIGVWASPPVVESKRSGIRWPWQRETGLPSPPAIQRRAPSATPNVTNSSTTTTAGPTTLTTPRPGPT